MSVKIFYFQILAISFICTSVAYPGGLLINNDKGNKESNDYNNSYEENDNNNNINNSNNISYNSWLIVIIRKGLYWYTMK